MKSEICTICCIPFFIPNQMKLDPSYLSLLEKLGFYSDKLSDSDNVNSDNMSLLACTRCTTSVTCALEAKEELTGLEESVRVIQTQILELQREVIQLLKGMEKIVGGYVKAAGGLEGILEESGGKVRTLDGFFAKRDCGQELLKQGIQFRDRVLAVVQDLHWMDTTVAENGQKKFKSRLNAVEEEELSVPKVPFRRFLKRKVYGKPIKVMEKQVDNVTKGNNNKPINKVPAVKQEQREEIDEPPSPVYDDPFSNDDHDDYNDPEISSPKSPKLLNNEVGGEEEDNGSEDDDDEYLPTKLAKQKMAKGKSKVKMFLSKYNVDTSGMSPFRRSLLYRVFKQSEKDKGERWKLRDEEDASNFYAIDPLRTHPISYNSSAGTLHMGGITLSINEQEKCFECNNCGEKFNTKMYRSFYTHVLGSSHLDLFQCPHCPSKPTSYHLFKDHVLSHGGKYACDICGKTLKRSDILRKHKWSHMNEEEKQEAIKKGAKPPSVYQSIFKARQTTVQCATCGKAFHTMGSLKRHEKEIHQEPQEVCSLCGKKFRSKGYLNHHQKYVCIPDKDNPEARNKVLRFECDICLKKFSHEAVVRRHKIMAHSEERPFKCDYCEKRFKVVDRLKAHQRSHLDERPVECRKGCGARYKSRGSASRHEKKCCI